MTSIAIKNIPKELAHPMQKVIRGTLRGRGPRIHNGRRHYQDLPKRLSDRFTLYTSYGYPRQYLNFSGINEDGKVRLTYNQADKK